MPVGFLSDDQVRAYTAFEELPSLSDLEKFFFLDAFDRDVIAKSRQDSHRLGVAVQIGTVRFKGLFLEDPLAVPWPVVDYLAEQLRIGDPSQVKRYAERSKTAYEHAWMIRDAYTHLADISTRMDDLPRSLVALLISESCNVGLTPVIKDGDAALTRGRLSHVDQNYVRAETHAAANAILIEAQRGVPIVALWGGGLLASVDGLRFVVPVQTINAAPSPSTSAV
jgi:TnpA family transposase